MLKRLALVIFLGFAGGFSSFIVVPLAYQGYRCMCGRYEGPMVDPEDVSPYAPFYYSFAVCHAIGAVETSEEIQARKRDRSQK